MDKIGVKVWDRILCCTTSWSPMAKSMEAMFLFVNLRRNLADCSLDANLCFKFPSYKKDLVYRRWSAIGIWWPDMLTWSSSVWDSEVLFFTWFWMLRGNVIRIFAFGPRINFCVFLSSVFCSKLQEFWLFPGRFLQICCKELAKLDHAGDNYGEVAEDLCDRLAIPGAMIFDPHVWLLVNRHE